MKGFYLGLYCSNPCAKKNKKLRAIIFQNSTQQINKGTVQNTRENHYART